MVDYSLISLEEINEEQRRFIFKYVTEKKGVNSVYLIIGKR